MGLSITILIIIVTVIVSMMAFSNRDLFIRAAFSPYQVFHRKEFYRFISHALLHANWFHLFVNMYVLYIFGRSTEEIFVYYNGPKGLFFYFLLYLGGIIFATLPSMRKHKDNYLYTSVGASGAVSAVVFSFIIFNPFAGMGLLIIPGVYIPAILFGVLYLVYEAYMDKRAQDYVAHDAHYYGAIFGVLFTCISTPEAFMDFIDQFKDYFS